MEEECYKNPFISLLTLKTEEDSFVHGREMIKGLRMRFEQNINLRNALFRTRGSQLVYAPNTDAVDPVAVLSLLNNIRNDSSKVFDTLRSIEVPIDEVIGVIDGVEREILNNPYLSDDLVYTDLLKYYKKNTRKNIPQGDPIFKNINNIVPILKYRLRETIWSNEIDKFKHHLLDTYLDYLLETEYPNIMRQDYAQAKQQQIKKEGDVTVERYENQLYSLYLNADIDDLVLRRLTFIPDNILKEHTPKELEIENPEEFINEFVIDNNSPFLPQFEDPVKIDGRIFSSAIHYAYWKLFQYIGQDVNINKINMANMQTIYIDEKYKWIYEKMKENNEIATTAKLQQNETIIHLLALSSGFTDILWNDINDPMLGTGKYMQGGQGDNLSGRFLMFMRDQILNGRLVAQNKLMSSFTSISNNIWTRSWMIARAIDFRNIMRLFKTPTTQILSDLYGIEVINGLFDDGLPKRGAMMRITNDDNKTLQRIGLSETQIVVCYPLISSQYTFLITNENVRVVTEIDMLKTVINDFNNSKPSKDVENIANNRLTLFFDKYNNELIEGVDKKVFMYTILSGESNVIDDVIDVNRQNAAAAAAAKCKDKCKDKYVKNDDSKNRLKMFFEIKNINNLVNRERVNYWAGETNLLI
jgi:predicted NAD-dependent protein-ADP-ribosyltransferase YbiA (DUF1768 family)